MYPSLSVDFQEKELLILESEFFQEHQCQRGVPEKEKKKEKKIVLGNVTLEGCPIQKNRYGPKKIPDDPYHLINSTEPTANSTHIRRQELNQATLVEGECSLHCPIPSSTK